MFLIRSHFCCTIATLFLGVPDLFSQENGVPSLFSLYVRAITMGSLTRLVVEPGFAIVLLVVEGVCIFAEVVHPGVHFCT